MERAGGLVQPAMHVEEVQDKDSGLSTAESESIQYNAKKGLHTVPACRHTVEHHKQAN